MTATIPRHDDARKPATLGVVPVGTPELAWIFGVKPRTPKAWAYREVMPAPRWTVHGWDTWELWEVMAWGRATGRVDADVEQRAREWAADQLSIHLAPDPRDSSGG